ncbi:cytochrome C oxidase [Devosia limi DSM 17137]|uniref:cytochrome-c oxidase n=1 Tax=Devosia limi DSM 17137 TaxID=1121477 RepID=A0A0F5LNI4_9HYPH|nr:cytochrome c oxidase subunit II [Devosia limi]KKB83888.1 cytochrome C oxidase [Devosia limi DSM 17137]SHE44838.1 cytochrome c oxidase subunit 2 [Devosia limi DSM 17137]
MVIAVVLVLIVVGSVLFHFLSPWWFSPLASNWNYIDDTTVLTFWICGAVFSALLLFVAYCLFRFRHTEGRKAAYEPENKRLEGWLTAITAGGVIAMLAPGLLVWAQFVQVPPAATDVEVIGQQWLWSFRLPGADGQLGAADNRLVSPDNTLGVSPTDPAGQDDVLIEGGELLIPVGRPVRFLLRSIDVLHNFYVPEFRAKMDMIPGSVTYFWVTPTQPGTYEILCAELCGVGHSYMRGVVTVVTEEDYQAWLSGQATFASLSL